jgi:hypothetical protein
MIFMNLLLFKVYFCEFNAEWLANFFMDDPIFPGSEYLQSSQETALKRIFRHLSWIASLRISQGWRER